MPTARGSIHVFDDKVVLWSTTSTSLGHAVVAPSELTEAELGKLIRTAAQPRDGDPMGELESSGESSWRDLWSKSLDVWFAVESSSLVLRPTERTRRYSWRQLDPSNWVQVDMSSSDVELGSALKEALSRSS